MLVDIQLFMYVETFPSILIINSESTKLLGLDRGTNDFDCKRRAENVATDPPRSIYFHWRGIFS